MGTGPPMRRAPKPTRVAQLSDYMPTRIYRNFPTVTAWLYDQLFPRVLDAIEQQVISGDGSGENMTGILYQPYSHLVPNRRTGTCGVVFCSAGAASVVSSGAAGRCSSAVVGVGKMPALELGGARCRGSGRKGCCFSRSFAMVGSR
jgi:hypothetical protein